MSRRRCDSRNVSLRCLPALLLRRNAKRRRPASSASHSAASCREPSSGASLYAVPRWAKRCAASSARISWKSRRRAFASTCRASTTSPRSTTRAPFSKAPQHGLRRRSTAQGSPGRLGAILREAESMLKMDDHDGFARLNGRFQGSVDAKLHGGRAACDGSVEAQRRSARAQGAPGIRLNEGGLGALRLRTRHWIGRDAR